MKHLFIFTVLIPIVLGFMIYKAIEAIINVVFSISDIKKRVSYQLNIFSLERLILKIIKNGYRKMGLPIW